ncbi:Uncharacterized protein TCM_035710 [Theobroma cacao]|uniref:Uncharacterized protein n=1 Tax=Theobroma cacao TaxID=3641 RepID=A0A061FJH5_THECC|nr:Uncharacterized protein TCM_035710 [Theobroma cacao]
MQRPNGLNLILCFIFFSQIPNIRRLFRNGKEIGVPDHADTAAASKGDAARVSSSTGGADEDRVSCLLLQHLREENPDQQEHVLQFVGRCSERKIRTVTLVSTRRRS